MEVTWLPSGASWKSKSFNSVSCRFWINVFDASLQRGGKVRDIGVSNFSVEHLKELQATAEIKPCVNQIECHPLLFQPELEAYCRDNGIAITAYSGLKPLSIPEECHELHLVLNDLATKYNTSKAMVLNRCCRPCMSRTIC